MDKEKKVYPDYNPNKITYSDSGSQNRDTFKFEYDDELGCPRSVKSGTIDYQAYIDASKDSTDINLIVQRVNAGNLSPLHVMDGNAVYEDVSKLPNNMQELSKFTDKLKLDFDKFDNDLKMLFDNDYNKFINCTIDGSINNIISNYANKKINSIKEDNKDESIS